MIEIQNKLDTIGILYVISLLIFRMSLFIPESFIFILPLRAISGLIVLFLIPGSLLASYYLPQSFQNIGIYFIVGLVITLFEIQIVFLASLFLSVHEQLVSWLIIASVVIVFIYFIKHLKNDSKLFNRIALGLDRTLLSIVLFAIAIRLLVSFLAPYSIAPDASFYSDFARRILDGNFNSLILNDAAAYNLWNGVQYAAHHGFTYVTALSFILVPPTLSGPSFILIVVGSVLVILAGTLAKVYFSEKAALWISMIVALHPLYIFHSVFAYGPEITTLLFLVFLFLLIHQGEFESSRTRFLAGILLALLDVIWYPNFMIGCLVLPLVIYGLKFYKSTDGLLFTFSMLLVIIARLLFTSILVFLLLWITIFTLPFIGKLLKGTTQYMKFIPLYFGVFITSIFWKFPVQYISSLQPGGVPETSPFVDIILAQIPLEVIERFILFAGFHLSIGILILLLLVLLKREWTQNIGTLFLMSLISMVGTLKIFGHFTKETLTISYLYSDSRFFLFSTMMLIIASGVLISKIDFPSFQSITKQQFRIDKKQKKSLIVFSLIIIGFLPGYIGLPSGTSLTNIEARYGWTMMDEFIVPIGNEDSIFLVDRAREFSWFTGRKSVVLELSQVNLDIFNAGSQLMAISNRFNASYLLIDEYTIARWGVYEYLITNSITIGNTMILDSSKAIEQQFNNITDSIGTLELVCQSQTNDFGSYSRIYQFSNNSFIHFSNENLLESGWSASNGGSISNSSGEVRLTVGPGAYYTNTWRPLGPDLNLDIDSGYLIFAFEDAGATIARIEIYDSEGSLISYAAQVNDELYYCPFGEVEIGDIRIVVEGNPGDSVIIKSIAAWEAI
ncbi:MAG: hypothetical protein ACTSV2_07165 [Candidatus Thorarchaeota archaeon]